MKNNCLILCGGARPRQQLADKSVGLELWDSASAKSNVTLKISDINQRMVANIPPVLLDLLEIATYVYCADQATSRGGDGTRQMNAKWRRNFIFHIPVRNPSLWSSSNISETLSETLSFLSDDDFNFEFHKLTHAPADLPYFEFDKNAASKSFDEVMLFSGGLDSLAGAVEELVINKRNVALVSHRSSPKIFTRQKGLVEDLRRYAKSPFLHIPVWVHKDKALGREYTQRTRSFLFASLGMVVARLLNLWRIRFYENGVISLNLPISAQLIGSRASRTTHPLALKNFSKFFGELLQHDFSVENPFVWKTKTEVVDLISKSGCGDLIKHSTSCTHTWEMTTIHSHCGRCSQCVDRRFATLASKNGNNDPSEMYAADLLTSDRKRDIDMTLVESYVRNATELQSMSSFAFFQKYQELTRVLPHLNGNIDQTATKIFELHQRHAKQVCGVVDTGFKEYASDFREGKLPETCLLALALPSKYKQNGNKPQKDLKRFPTPNGATWDDLYMKFIDGETIRIRVLTIERTAKYNDMNMIDGRGGGNKRNKQWGMLEDFAHGHGCFSWDSASADRKCQKRRENLAKQLKAYFNLPGEPIEYDETSKGWKANFHIEPVS